jgi:HK97 family phage portal protein
MTGHVLLRGNAYSQIVPGPRGPVDQLIPIHPDRVTVEQLPNNVVRYRVRNNDGTQTVLNDEDMLHIRGLSDDGVTGLSVVSYAANSMGMAIAAEQYGSRFFRNDSRPGGVLKHPGKVKDPQRIKDSWESLHSGENAHTVAVLEEGMEWQQIGISPEEAQFLQTREFQVADIARWFRVPLHMIQETSNVTSWGTGIEQQQLGFVMFTLLPWARRWEQAISRDLILATNTYYAEFLVDALVRGDLKSRYDAYAVGRSWGWLSINEIRRLENMNPISNGDQYLQPLNMVPIGQNVQPSPAPQPGLAHYRLLLTEAAGRVIRREQGALQKAAKRAGGDAAAWEHEVSEFYAGHIAFVAQAMGISSEDSLSYVNRRARLALYAQGKADVVDAACGQDEVEMLVQLARGSDAD